MIRHRNRKQTPSFESLEHRFLLAVDLLSVSPGKLGNHIDLSARTVDVSQDLQLNFNKPVTKADGFITIQHTRDNQIVESIDVQSSRVTVAGSTVLVDPVNDLPPDADLFITVDPAAFVARPSQIANSILLDEDFDRLPLENSSLDTPFDDYVVVVRGKLDVKVSGTYTFGVNGGDGQMLSIDVARDGLDLAEDAIIQDDSRHNTEDRLHTCGRDELVQSCVGAGKAEAISLSRGTYSFDYRYFDRGGGSGGEFFYARGYHEAFDADEFVLVGDDSKGIDVTSIKATTFKALEGFAINDLATANALAQTDFFVLPRPVVAGTETSTGRDAVFRVDRIDTDYTLELVNAGTGYKESDELNVQGEDVGGQNGENDIRIRVLAVTETGGIDMAVEMDEPVGYSFSGVAEDPLECPGTAIPSQPSECIDTVDLYDSGSQGRFTDDPLTEEVENNHAVPAAEDWNLERDGSTANWSKDAPSRWTRDQSELEKLRPGGQPEYNGWTFLDRDFWIAERNDSFRSLFELGEDTVALVDANGFADSLNIDPTEDPALCLSTGAPENCGFFSASLSTPRIRLGDAIANTAVLSFDSSWWDEDTQAAELAVEFFDGNGQSIANNLLFRWDSIPESEFYKPVFDPVTFADARNESLSFNLGNPENAASMVITFSMPHAQNDWWWAIDNVKVTANTNAEFFAGVVDSRTWRFATTPLVRFEAREITVNEDVGSIMVHIERDSSAANPWPFNVDFEIAGMSATSGSLDDEGNPEPGADFTASPTGSFRFMDVLPGAILRENIMITIHDDEIEESNETIRISLKESQTPRAGDTVPIFEQTELIVTIVDNDRTSLPGDINGDGMVNFTDFLILSTNFNKPVEPGKDGDIDGDGLVGFGDFLVLSTNFGKQLAAEPVREASDLVFAALASDNDESPADDGDDFDPSNSSEFQT